MAIFAVHALLEIEVAYTTSSNDIEYEGNDWKFFFLLISRLVGNFGGIAVVLYGICWVLARCCTRNQLENYLVSELFHT